MEAYLKEHHLHLMFQSRDELKALLTCHRCNKSTTFDTLYYCEATKQISCYKCLDKCISLREHTDYLVEHDKVVIEDADES